MKSSIFTILMAMVLATVFSVNVRAETLPQPLDSAALAAESGMGETVNLAQVNSNVDNNTIGNVGYTGGINNVSASNNSGMTTMIENTGNQVSISTSTVINVNYH